MVVVVVVLLLLLPWNESIRGAIGAHVADSSMKAMEW
jgi:hypothetical protein